MFTGVLSSALVVATALPVGATVVPSGAKTVKKIAVTTSAGEAVAKKGVVSVPFPANAAAAGYTASEAFIVELTGKGASKGFKVKDSGNAIITSDGETGILAVQATAGEAEKSTIKVTSKAKNKKGKKLKYPFVVSFEEDASWVEVESVKAAIDKDTIAVGETAQVSYTVVPEGAVLGANFESSDITVAAVDETGMVLGVGAGTATITVTAGEKSDSVKVTVTEEPEPSELVGVSLDYSSIKVGDTISAVLDPVNANNVDSYQWYINGVAVEGAVNDSFTIPTTANIGDTVTVIVTDTEGNTFESPAATVSDKSEEEIKTEITIADVSGLQTDGTGLVGDLLTLSYGSELGIPKTITWYYNEKVVKAWDSNGGSLDAALKLLTGSHIVGGQETADFNGLLKDGNYYAMILNSEGKSFKSNTIALTYVEPNPAPCAGSLS